MQPERTQPSDLTKRLPVKILTMIFESWKDSCDTMQHGLPAEWVRATWVCKTWLAVALAAPILWSSVLVSRQAANTPALEVQLDRAWGVALDVLISSHQMSEAQVKDALNLVLAKKKAIKTLTIAFENQHRAAIETLLESITDELTSLSVRSSDFWQDERWTFAQGELSRLCRLALDCIMPVAEGRLLNLTHLHLDGVVETFSEKVDKPWTFVHRFLVACPNLEALRSVDSFEYPLEYRDEHNDYKDLPVVTLPKLRYLSTEGLALDMSTALGTLRLPALTTFDITAQTGMDPYDCDFYVIPRNVSAALPLVRRSRCLSLMVGGPANDLSLQGGLGDTFDDESDWSITFTDLEVTDADSEFLRRQCCMRYNCSRFLARISQRVVPSKLVHLELHVANGLPVAQDWAQIFAPMAHLRTLVIGCGALIRRILAAFTADTRLFPELEELELCFGLGPTASEEAVLAELIPRAIGAWVCWRVMPLKTLMVLSQMGSDSDSGSEDLSSECSSDAASEAEGQRDGLRNTESADLKLWRHLATNLKPDAVSDVFLATMDCPTCSVEYESLDSVEFGNGGLTEGVTY